MFVKYGKVNHRYRRSVTIADECGMGHVIASISSGQALFKQRDAIIAFPVTSLTIKLDAPWRKLTRATFILYKEHFLIFRMVLYHLDRVGRVQVIACLHERSNLCYLEQGVEVKLNEHRDALDLQIRGLPDGELKLVYFDERGRSIQDS